MKSFEYIKQSFHGGHCCGMTTIWKFGGIFDPVFPKDVLAARARRSSVDQAAYTQATPVYGLVLNDAYPEQTAGDRLKMMISNITNGVPEHAMKRPFGIIEIALQHQQLLAWEEFILSLGFKEVNKWKNSNTGNIVHVFHLNTGADVMGDDDDDEEEED